MVTENRSVIAGDQGLLGGYRLALYCESDYSYITLYVLEFIDMYTKRVRLTHVNLKEQKKGKVNGVTQKWGRAYFV